MKFLHTADWHVGKTLKGRSRLEEHKDVLRQIVQVARDQDVDAVLIAGDLYDTAAPSAEAQRLVNHTLLALAQDGREVVVIAGNHDHANTFEALSPVMRAAGIEYAGRVRATVEGGVHRFTARTGEEVVVVMLPFLSRRFVYSAEQIVTGTPSENAGRYDEAIRTILARLSEAFDPTAVNLVMAHVTCTGGQMGGGEREAQSIFEYHVPASAFPVDAHYVALGHLHRRQVMPAACPVHYSGAPLPVDFGEQENTPVVCIVEASPGLPVSVEDVPITVARRLRTVSGTFAELTDRAPDFGDDYLRVVLQEPTRAGLRDAVLDVLPNALEIRIDPSFIKERSHARQEHAAKSPRELFAVYCDEIGVSDTRVAALFDELHDEIAR